MPGTFIPPWFVDNPPTPDEFATASVIWGISLGLTLFATIRATNQTYKQWNRKHKVTAYMVFIWLELISSAIIGGTAWGYMRQDIPPSFWYYAGTNSTATNICPVFLWFFQTHCILQIIINRIGLIALNKTFIHRLKWFVFFIVLLINIAVACIWIPSRLQISRTYITINNYWDRAEKAVLATIDLCLNVYFVYLVRSSLIAYGLTKYVRLYRFNLVMIAVSLSMDVLIIAMMSLANTFLYVSFHPLAYLVKLHIELSMAELIGKIVKASNRRGNCICNCHGANAFHIEEICTVSEVTEDIANEMVAMAPTTGRLKQWLTLRPARSRDKTQTLKSGSNHSMNSRAASDQGKGVEYSIS
ncbi:unnamed protein product [Clonostachys rosea]|uniref:Integral membrane protein n=1 Tax=Bionectria ochroleuca TaxID=29856 RepID=A0ABY6UK85_BIOOC|nr:unnamed protein product [Clonostachys rosea]